MKKISILVCTLISRKHFLDRLMGRLCPQINDQVEVIVGCDSGEKSIGAKRNELVQKASQVSEFCCFVDDDDLISEDYISKILTALETNPDCVGIEGTITFDGVNTKKFIHSLRYDCWYEENGVFIRTPNHLNPVKTEIAKQVPFAEINHGEDSDYSNRIKPLLKTEVYINGPIYFYEFRTQKNINSIPRRMQRIDRRRR